MAAFVLLPKDTTRMRQNRARYENCILMAIAIKRLLCQCSANWYHLPLSSRGAFTSSPKDEITKDTDFRSDSISYKVIINSQSIDQLIQMTYNVAQLHSIHENGFVEKEFSISETITGNSASVKNFKRVFVWPRVSALRVGNKSLIHKLVQRKRSRCLLNLNEI